MSPVISLNMTKESKIKNRPMSPALNFTKHSETIKMTMKDKKILSWEGVIEFCKGGKVSSCQMICR